MYELHGFARSSATYRVRIALALKELGYEAVDVNLAAGAQHEPEFRTLNPQGLVPVYSDEQTVLTQSLAIIEYLDERYPEPPLLPQQPAARARVRQLAQIAAADVQPFGTPRVDAYLRNTLRLDAPGRRRWFQHWLLEGLDAIELWLTAEGGDGRYCVGDAVTLADVCLVPLVEFARRLRLDIEDFPRVAGIERSCMALPAFAATHPDAAR
ncbi:MAG: maleylacetoacetate isomerase [Gammaproteobacteria bacterium]